MTTKTAKWEWTEEHEAAFNKLRQHVCEAPVLAYPCEKGQWILDTDASAYANGAVLSQIQTNEDGAEVERVISYASRKLKGAEQRYCTRRRELLAIVEFVKLFRPYLWDRHVLIRTDHASLRYIKTQENPDYQSLTTVDPVPWRTRSITSRFARERNTVALPHGAVSLKQVCLQGG